MSEKGHGRIETRRARLLTDIDWLKQRRQWKGLKGLGCVTTTVTTISTGEVREYTRYLITSLTDLDEFMDAVRKHWRIENNLHWCLDVILREDSCRARKDNAPINLNLMRKFVLEVLHKSKVRGFSKQRMMGKASRNEEYMYELLTAGAIRGNGSVRREAGVKAHCR